MIFRCSRCIQQPNEVPEFVVMTHLLHGDEAAVITFHPFVLGIQSISLNPSADIPPISIVRTTSNILLIVTKGRRSLALLNRRQSKDECTLSELRSPDITIMVARQEET